MQEPVTATDSVPVEKVEVDALFLANGVEIREGFIYVLGGGWSRCWSPTGEYPFEYGLNVVALFRVPYFDSNIEHTFQISVKNSDEQELAFVSGAFKVGRDVSLTQGMSQLVPLAGSVKVTLERVGIYQIVLNLDGREAKRIAFEVLPHAPR